MPSKKRLNTFERSAILKHRRMHRLLESTQNDVKVADRFLQRNNGLLWDIIADRIWKYGKPNFEVADCVSRIGHILYKQLGQFIDKNQTIGISSIDYDGELYLIYSVPGISNKEIPDEVQEAVLDAMPQDAMWFVESLMSIEVVDVDFGWNDVTVKCRVII